jgi:hypothetical protein
VTTTCAARAILVFLFRGDIFALFVQQFSSVFVYLLILFLQQRRSA